MYKTKFAKFVFILNINNFIFVINQVNELPESIKCLLKWKMCSITPNIVKSTINRSSFKFSTHKSDWIGVWGSHMKPECFKSIKEFQKVKF
jgi:tubulin polyglutamylase TTLL4